MGSSTWTIDLEPAAGATPASNAELRRSILLFLEDAWQNALSEAEFEVAWGWVSGGDDSLLTFQAPADAEDEAADAAPATALTFRFYNSVSWPEALAGHWLALALIEHRTWLEERLTQLGYRLAPAAWYPSRAALTDRFIQDGDRTGHPVADGVWWQVPEHRHDPAATLTDDQRAADAPCECSYCAYFPPD